MAVACNYAIVEFFEQRLSKSEVAIAPVTWLSTEEDSCRWPPKNSQRIQECIPISEKFEATKKLLEYL